MFKLAKLNTNLRFYILAISVVMSIFMIGFMRQIIPSDQLYYIRLQQIFGFLAVAYLYVAMILTPLSTILGKRSYMQKLLFARRAIGVAAFYFVLLHIAIVVVKQLGGLSGLSLLQGKFQVSLLLGAGATLILLLMAATSFDNVIRWMTFPKWKLLHRFVYVAGLFTILHIWMIGTHINNDAVRFTGYVALAVLFCLESIRMGIKLSRRLHLDRAETNIVTAFIFIVFLSFIAVIPNLAWPIHSSHERAATEGL